MEKGIENIAGKGRKGGEERRKGREKRRKRRKKILVLKGRKKR